MLLKTLSLGNKRFHSYRSSIEEYRTSAINATRHDVWGHLTSFLQVKNYYKKAKTKI